MNYEYAPDPYVPTDLQALRPVGRCFLCDDALWLGACCYHLEGAFLCEDCLPRYARVYFRSARVRIGAAP